MKSKGRRKPRRHKLRKEEKRRSPLLTYLPEIIGGFPIAISLAWIAIAGARGILPTERPFLFYSFFVGTGIIFLIRGGEMILNLIKADEEASAA